VVMAAAARHERNSGGRSLFSCWPGAPSQGDLIRAASSCSFRITKVSRCLQISDRQLQRYTRKWFGRSAQAWLDDERLTLAANLVCGAQQIKAISLDLGFKQTSHFCRKFKAFYGLSATKFRLLAKTRGAPRTSTRTSNPGKARRVGNEHLMPAFASTWEI
jgi:AraC-like DNA-binding protein